jgi:endonuclease/exonuclease/phosphatase family metal-dependent hydrolase
MAKKNFSIFNTFLLIFNIAAVIALLMAYLASYLNPKLYFLAALSGLFYPYILLINVIFVILWLFRKWKFCFISLITIALGFNSFQRFYQFRGKDVPAETELIKVLSYNVQIFGLYNNTDNQGNIIEFLQEEAPDITCLQEYCQENASKPKLLAAKDIKNAINAKDYYAYTPLSRNKYEFGMAIFSKFPIINRGVISFDNVKTNHAIFADLKINEDTVRVYNVHFQSIFFGAEDYLFAQQAASTTDFTNDELKKNSIRILKKIKAGFAKRPAQVDEMVKHIKLSPYKTIVCGDFNDTPWSYTYKQMQNLLDDSFVNSGKGRSYTVIINKLLSFRIDYIFHDKSFKSYGFTTKKLDYSDHYPVWTCFSL